MTEVLSSSELKGLKEHKYSVVCNTLLDPLMQVYWRWLVDLLPMWWAPNAITLAGLLVNIVTTLILIMYSPDAKQEAPSWAYFLTAFGVFVYQSLDAVDGKQARRTNSASPLGELFDHGCDAVSLVFLMMGFCITILLGNEPYLLFAMMLTSMFIFYTAHWVTYCTGTLRFGLLDVTEAQIGIMIVSSLAGIFGPSIYTSQLPIIGLQAKMIPYLASLFCVIITAYSYFSIIFVQGGIGRSGSTVADTSVLGPAVPIGSMLGFAYYIMAGSPEQIYHKHPVLYLLMFGMISTKITCRLVIAHMSRSEMELFDSAFAGPLLMLINMSLLNCMIPEYFLLWVSFLYVSMDLWIYVSRVVRQLCDYLDIYCFKITPPQSQQQKNTSASSCRSSSNDGVATRSRGTTAQQRRT